MHQHCVSRQHSLVAAYLCDYFDFYCGEIKSLIDLEIGKWVRLAGIHLSLLPQHGDHEHAPPHWAFPFSVMWILETEFQSSNTPSAELSPQPY